MKPPWNVGPVARPAGVPRGRFRSSRGRGTFRERNGHYRTQVVDLIRRDPSPLSCSRPLLAAKRFGLVANVENKVTYLVNIDAPRILLALPPFDRDAVKVSLDQLVNPRGLVTCGCEQVLLYFSSAPRTLRRGMRLRHSFQRFPTFRVSRPLGFPTFRGSQPLGRVTRSNRGLTLLSSLTPCTRQTHRTPTRALRLPAARLWAILPRVYRSIRWRQVARQP